VILSLLTEANTLNCDNRDEVPESEGEAACGLGRGFPPGARAPARIAAGVASPGADRAALDRPSDRPGESALADSLNIQDRTPTQMATTHAPPINIPMASLSRPARGPEARGVLWVIAGSP
jgi:hypothetical protein